MRFSFTLSVPPSWAVELIGSTVVGAATDPVAFDITKLLLTADRQSQLTAALANATETTPLVTIIAEAEARVTEEVGDLTLSQSILDSLIRSIALYQAYTVAEGPVPEDIKDAYEKALEFMEQLRTGAIAVEGSALIGDYGGDDPIEARA